MSDCTQDATECDTQVFVTWAGRDNSNEDCISDNFRISDFNNFGIASYVDGAKAVSDQTYDQTFPTTNVPQENTDEQEES